VPAPGNASLQPAAVVEVVRAALGENLVAIYLYGSAVEGGLKPASDLDLFAVATGPTTQDERRRLVRELMPISRRGQRPADWRPVELTVAALADIQPWRFPPRTDFQYGEWLRDRFDAGDVDPEHPDNPDLALLIEMVRRTGRSLVGPSAVEILPDVPFEDLRAALMGVVPGLMSDLESDTANVLLTLARILYTLETGEFTSKDAAANRAITQLDSNLAIPLAKARDVYLGSAADDWAADAARARVAADFLQNKIEQQADH